ncbi:histidine--tRNA ligase [Candidatus Latescibacterota bacterium]
MNLAPTRGTRDFFPEELRLRDWLFGHFREVARQFAFEEYDTPVLESEELYVRKAGEEIVDQLYAFEDKGGRRLALRPEMTPSLARLVLQRVGSLALPIKWFSIPQCWRYERMTRGRRREHYQWNMDILGVPGVEAEAELMAAVVALLTRVGLSSADVVIRVSSRKILQAVTEEAGIPPEHFAPVCILIDKLEKVPRQDVEAEVAALGIDPAIVGRVVDIAAVQSLDELSRILDPEQGGIAELIQLFSLAEAYGYANWLRFDASLVRGLAYYTGVVFEAFAREGELRAICGGGRYDRLLSTFGGKDVPACGLGFGDAVIVELLTDTDLLPELDARVDDVVFAFSSELRAAAVQVAGILRRQGRSVDLVLEDRKMKWAFRHGDAVGAARLVLLAPDEWSRGLIRVRDLATGDERDVPLDEL